MSGHTRTYARSTRLCFASIKRTKTSGCIRLEVQRDTGLSRSVLSHVLKILVESGQVAYKLAAVAGEKCVNRRRYYAADFAPAGAVFFHPKPVAPVVEAMFSDVVFAPSEACPMGWPPSFTPRYVPDKKASVTQAESAATHRANGGYDRHRLGLDGGTEFLRMTGAAA